jgi:hypothetical protein
MVELEDFVFLRMVLRILICQINFRFLFLMVYARRRILATFVSIATFSTMVIYYRHPNDIDKAV